MRQELKDMFLALSDNFLQEETFDLLRGANPRAVRAATLTTMCALGAALVATHPEEGMRLYHELMEGRTPLKLPLDGIREALGMESRGNTNGHKEI
jgi:hypothetical protein